jgi:hypothetical protein
LKVGKKKNGVPQIDAEKNNYKKISGNQQDQREIKKNKKWCPADCAD